jgi:hypothetical protein
LQGPMLPPLPGACKPECLMPSPLLKELPVAVTSNLYPNPTAHMVEHMPFGLAVRIHMASATKCRRYGVVCVGQLGIVGPLWIHHTCWAESWKGRVLSHAVLA